MSTQISRQQANEILEKRFKGKYVKFHYPGYAPMHGRCDRIMIGEGREASLVVIIMEDSRYTCSPDQLKECLTLLTKSDGNSYTGGEQSAEGSS